MRSTSRAVIQGFGGRAGIGVHSRPHLYGSASARRGEAAEARKAQEAERAAHYAKFGWPT